MTDKITSHRLKSLKLKTTNMLLLSYIIKTNSYPTFGCLSQIVIQHVGCLSQIVIQHFGCLSQTVIQHFGCLSMVSMTYSLSLIASMVFQSTNTPGWLGKAKPVWPRPRLTSNTADLQGLADLIPIVPLTQVVQETHLITLQLMLRC